MDVKMSLNAALVDRARRLAETPLGQRVEGTTQFTTLTGQWFKARLTLDAAPESDDAQGGRVRVRRPATLLCGLRDLDRNDLEFAATDRVEVDSRELGRNLFEVTGDPQPIRKKRRLLGWTVTLVRVDDHEFARVQG